MINEQKQYSTESMVIKCSPASTIPSEAAIKKFARLLQEVAGTKLDEQAAISAVSKYPLNIRVELHHLDITST